MKNLLILILFASLSWAHVSHAKSQLAISQDVYEKMQDAQVLVDQKKYAEAELLLKSILSRPRLNAYEKAQTMSLQGNIYFHQEKYDQAITVFKQSVELEDLPTGFLQITLRTIAQLAFMQDQFEDALRYTKRLEAMTPVPDPANRMLLAQIYYKTGKVDDALSSALDAVDMERQKGKAVPENWLLVLNAIYYDKGQFDKIVDVLKELIEQYPKKVYVMNLAAVYGQIEKSEQQLLLLEPLYDKGYLSRQSELLSLANLMLHHRVPFKSAKIIEQGFKDGTIERNTRNLELLAQSWQLAAEDSKSIQYLAEAARLSDDPHIYLRLAQSHMNLYQWKEAERTLIKALEGKLEKQGNAWLLLGMSRFYQKEYRSARKAFKTAEQFDDSSALAVQWIAYLDSERAKADAAEGLVTEVDAS